MKTSRKYSRLRGVIAYPQLGSGSLRPYPTQQKRSQPGRGVGGLRPYPVQKKKKQRGRGYPKKQKRRRGVVMKKKKKRHYGNSFRIPIY